MIYVDENMTPVEGKRYFCDKWRLLFWYEQGHTFESETGKKYKNGVKISFLRAPQRRCSGMKMNTRMKMSLAN